MTKVKCYVSVQVTYLLDKWRTAGISVGTSVVFDIH